MNEACKIAKMRSILIKHSPIDLAHPYFYYDFHDKSTGQAQLQRYELDDISGRISI